MRDTLESSPSPSRIEWLTKIPSPEHSGGTMPDSHRLPCYALEGTPEYLPNLPDSFRQAILSPISRNPLYPTASRDLQESPEIALNPHSEINDKVLTILRRPRDTVAEEERQDD